MGVGVGEVEAQAVVLLPGTVGDEADGQGLHGFQALHPHQDLVLSVAVKQLAAPLQGLQGIPDAGEVGLALLGELHALAPAFKKADVQFLFQVGDGVAQRGLGHMELRRRLGELAALGDLLEIVELLQVHSASAL